MKWFKHKEELLEEPEPIEEAPEPERVVVGLGPDLVKKVADKINEFKTERSNLINENKKLNNEIKELNKDKAWLADKIDELTAKFNDVESRCVSVEESFKSIQGSLKDSFLDEARKILKGLISNTDTLVSNVQSRLIRVEDDFINLNKDFDDLKFITAFNDYAEQVKLCTSIIKNAGSEDYNLISLLLQTIHEVVDDMRSQGLWSAAKDTVITSLLALKSHWRGRDERIEGLISTEINVFESLM